MGVVCEALDQETGRKVALKLVHFARPFGGDGRVDTEPDPHGPEQQRGPSEVARGSRRMHRRVTQARLCRCGGCATKPLCAGTHPRNGFCAD